MSLGSFTPDTTPTLRSSLYTIVLLTIGLLLLPAFWVEQEIRKAFR